MTVTGPAPAPPTDQPLLDLLSGFIVELRNAGLPVSLSENLADQVASIVRSIRQLDLKKNPSVSETLDWARTLVLLGIEQIDAKTATDTANVLLKYRTAIEKVVKEFADNPAELAGNAS